MISRRKLVHTEYTDRTENARKTYVNIGTGCSVLSSCIQRIPYELKKVLKRALATAAFTLFVPMINKGQFKLFANSNEQFSERAVRLVLPIEILAILKNINTEETLVFYSKSINRIALSILILFGSYASYAQQPRSATPEATYKGGGAVFYETVSKFIHYPKEARENGVMGLSAFGFKVDCNGKPHSFKFKTRLGFGIEEEIQSTIVKKLDSWLDCTMRDSSAWVNIKVAFVLNELYKSPDADLVFTAHGPFPGVSDDQLLKDYEKATKKGKDDDARAALTKLVMRFPYNQEYKKKLIEIAKK